jgi:hypothetical protein
MRSRRPGNVPRTNWLAVGALGLFACTGHVGEPDLIFGGGDRHVSGGAGGSGGATGSGGSSDMGPPGIGPGRMRRLTRPELENSIRDLLGPALLPKTEQDSLKDGFTSVGATYIVTTDDGVEQYHDALKAVAHDVFSDATLRAKVSGCSPTSVTDTACVRTFAQTFGRRAWRRPIASAEADRYTELGRSAAEALGDPHAALQYVALGMLESPNFLYRVEIGEPDPAQGGRYRYSGYETASRLSFLLWNTTPDDTLLSAADAGTLDTAQGIRDQTARLLGNAERARAGIGNYARELMELESFLTKAGDDPRYTDTLRAGMAAEVTRLFEDRLDPTADALDIFDTTRTFVNGELAALYGIPGITGPDGKVATLPSNIPRAGLLGTGLFLAKTSKIDIHETSLTARGVFINEQILCRDVPPPPDNVDTTLHPKPDKPETKRQMMEEHRTNAFCASCHGSFDPLGDAFEDFDWIGAHRTAEPNGLKVDTTGTFDGFAYANSKELVAHLRTLPEVQACFLNHIFRYANGHKETKSDKSVLDDWNTRFTNANHNLPSFLADIAASDEFRYVSVAP